MPIGSGQSGAAAIIQPLTLRGSLRCLLTFALVAGLMVLAWLPSLQSLQTTTADQVWENYGIAQSCIAQPDQLGWMGNPTPAAEGTLFAPSLPGQWLMQSACQLTKTSVLKPLQAYLLVGQVLTLLLALIACRWAGFSQNSALLGGFLLATAPCAFSRIGHLGLAVLIPVIPVLVGCLLLQRQMVDPRPPGGWRPSKGALVAGALAACLSVPAQDYYVVFAVLLLMATYGLVMLLATTRTLSLKALAVPAWRGAVFVMGFVAVVVLLYTPKLLLAGMPGPPADWSAPRAAIEQFRYGLLPLTWVIASPWVNGTLEALQQAGINTGTEAYFWSTGSLLIPMSWICAIRRLALPAPQQPPAGSAARGHGLLDQDRRFLALLLLLVSALGLLCMTMGGLGTLFAAVVTPVLRSLNRFTVFAYGAAVLYLLAEFDLWMQSRGQSS